MSATSVFLFAVLFSASQFCAAADQRPAEPLVIVQDGKYGYIDHNGTVLVKPQFLWAAGFEDGLGTAYVCGRTVAIDAKGNVLSLQAKQKPPNLRPIRRGNKWVFVDASGLWLGRAQFDDALPFSDGMAAVQVGDKWGFIDASGRIAIPPSFDSAYYFIKGVANANVGDDWVLIDKSGKSLARGYEQLEGVIADGLIPVSRDAKHGYLDLHGAVTIPLMYDGADTFSEGLAPVLKNGKWGYINKNNIVIIPFKFDYAGVFGSGLAPVRVGNQTGFIDTSGKFAFTLAFQQAPGFWNIGNDSDVSPFWTKDGAFGYVNSSGRVKWGLTKEVPDHAPITGWSEEDKIESCVGMPQAVKKSVASFPSDE